MTFRRIFCYSRLCLVCGVCSRLDRRQLDEDGIEMSCSRGGADPRHMVQHSAGADLTVSPNYRRRQQVLVEMSQRTGC
jgi:hypothetical protein